LASNPSKIENIIPNVLEFCLVRPRFASEIKEDISSEIPEKNMLSEEEREQAARVKRFLALTVRLQEGVLRYGERLKRAYRP